MNNLDKQYQELLKDILENGTQKGDRTGTGTKSLFGKQIRHKMSEGFPLLTTKKMAWKQIVTELLWFLRGDTNIKYLIDNECHIWDGDAYKNYKKHVIFSSNPYDRNIISSKPLEGVEGMGEFKIGDDFTKEQFIEKIKTDSDFSYKWGGLGPIYGKQWRNWDTPKILTIDKGIIENGVGTEWGSWERNPIDQIANLINTLKTNPDDRRMIVTAWNVADIDRMILPCCHYGFQVWTRELSQPERLALFPIYHPDKVLSDFKPDGLEVQSLSHQWDTRLNNANIPKRAISLMWNQRSVDTLLGLPFNIASYGLLLEILAKEVNMVPDELIGTLGDTHLYLNHLEQANEQMARTPYKLPKLDIKLHFNNQPSFVPENWLVGDFQIEDYQSHATIKAALSN
jgi:thymidylate synthase